MGIVEGLTQPSMSILFKLLQLLKIKPFFWNTYDLYNLDQRSYRFLSENMKGKKGDEEKGR